MCGDIAHDRLNAYNNKNIESGVQRVTERLFLMRVVACCMMPNALLCMLQH